jgi:hypothetical protein
MLSHPILLSHQTTIFYYILRALTMEATRTSETSVDIQLRIRQYIPEDSELHTRRRENLVCHKIFNFIQFNHAIFTISSHFRFYILLQQ